MTDLSNSQDGASMVDKVEVRKGQSQIAVGHPFSL